MAQISRLRHWITDEKAILKVLFKKEHGRRFMGQLIAANMFGEDIKYLMRCFFFISGITSNFRPKLTEF